MSARLKHPIILKGEGFDWEAGAEALRHVYDEQGRPNYQAAMMADPGVIKCPDCGVFLWR